MIQLPDFKSFYAKFSKWTWPVLGALVIILFWHGCGQANIIGDMTGVVDSLSKKTVFLENQNGHIVAQNKVSTVASGKQLEAITDSLFKLKAHDQKMTAKVVQYAQIIQKGQFRDKKAGWVEVPTIDSATGIVIQDPGPAPEDSDHILVPRPFRFQDSTIKFGGVVRIDGVHVDSIVIENKVHFRTIEKKMGFLRLGRSLEVQVINSNPAITTTGVTSLQVKQNLSWWNKWGKPALGVLIGGAIVAVVK